MTSFAASWDTGDGPFCPTCDKGTWQGDGGTVIKWPAWTVPGGL